MNGLVSAARIANEVDEAVALAENDPYPEPHETLEGVYADQMIEAPLSFADAFFAQRK